MTISLFTALKLIPWADVASNAPLVVDNAKKLWKAAGKAPATSAEIKYGLEPDAQTITVMASRVSALEVNVSDLRQEMVSSAGLIKALADQNAHLVRAVAFLRRLSLILIAALCCATVAGIYLLLLR